MRAEIEDAFLEWQCGISPDNLQDWVEFDSYDESLMCVFVWRHQDFDRILIAALENFLQNEVHPDLRVSTLMWREAKRQQGEDSA